MLLQLIKLSSKATFLILLLASCLAGTAQAYTTSAADLKQFLVPQESANKTGDLYAHEIAENKENALRRSMIKALDGFKDTSVPAEKGVINNTIRGAMAADIAALLGICLVSIFTYKKAGYFLRRISKKIKSIFSEIRTKLGRAKKDANIVGNDNLRSYSAADELLKWAELREKGIISEREFDEAREKILRKS